MSTAKDTISQQQSETCSECGTGIVPNPDTMCRTCRSHGTYMQDD